MTDRIKRIANIIMAHIYSCTDGAKEAAHIKFSPRTLRSTVNMTDDTIGMLEFNDTLTYLVDNKHLKKLGAHIYGLGTGKGLKRYPTNGIPTATKAKHLPDDKAQPRHCEGAARGNPEGTTEAAKTGADKTSVTVTVSPETQININHALTELEQRIKCPPRPHVSDLPTKILVLERLALIVDPTIGGVLEQIKDDLKGAAA